jgi:hypothetical protein
MDESERPNSLNAGGGKDGGGVAERDGRGDEVREASRTVGVDGEGVIASRGGGGGKLSRR